ncbi:MAG: ROK family protein [Gemmatimonadota bacterium]
MTDATTVDGSLMIGVDLGGTKTAVLAVDGAGGVVAGERYETAAADGPDAVLSGLAERIATVSGQLGDRPVVGVGVGVAGQVDPETGVVAYAPNLGWRDVPVRARLEAGTGLGVEVLNDVRAATYAESVYGAGRGERDLVCLFIGTGVGGGVIAGGRLLRGCTGSAGELGHMTVDLHGPRCGCGNRGCLEAFVGGRAIAARARERLEARPEAGPVLAELAASEPEGVTASRVAEAARRGDALGEATLAEAAEALVAGVASIVNGFNPCLILLGGGVIEGVPSLIDRVRRGLPVRALGPALRGLRVERAALGSDAGGVGAAAWARRRQAGADEAPA